MIRGQEGAAWRCACFPLLRKLYMVQVNLQVNLQADCLGGILRLLMSGTGKRAFPGCSRLDGRSGCSFTRPGGKTAAATAAEDEKLQPPRPALPQPALQAAE